MADELPFDLRWHGAPALVAAAIEGQANVLGPRTLDGVAYVAVRSDVAPPTPEGLEITGPELSAALVGVWMTGEL